MKNTNSEPDLHLTPFAINIVNMSLEEIFKLEQSLKEIKAKTRRLNMFIVGTGKFSLVEECIEHFYYSEYIRNNSDSFFYTFGDEWDELKGGELYYCDGAREYGCVDMDNMFYLVKDLINVLFPSKKN